MSFFGLGVSATGLFTSQRALANVSHNVDNANTPGYSRQVINQRASQALMMTSAGMLGTGAEVISIDRVRDSFLDDKFRTQNKFLGEYTVKSTVIEAMEAVYNEPSDGGYTKILNDFYSAMQQLSTNPEELSARALVKERGIALAKYFNNVAIRFEQEQEDLNQMVYAKVGQVNNLSDQIAKLNGQIYNIEVLGNKANDLRDQRDYLVDQLSKIVNVEAYEVETGYTLPNGDLEKRYYVTLSGKDLVSHVNSSHLTCVTRKDKLNEEDVEYLYEVQWEDGNTASIKSGELKGYLDMRDGNDGEGASPDVKGIPYYQKKMNEFVRTFAMAFNEGIIDSDGNGVLDQLISGHADGYGLDGSTGIRFFTMQGEEGKSLYSGEFHNGTTDINDNITLYSQLTAKNFRVSQDVIDDPSNNIAASADGEVGNNETVLSLIDMRHNTYMFMEGSGEDFIKTLISSLGVDGQQMKLYTQIQTSVVKQIDNRRMSESGVSLNEEMANMIRYQQVYGASAKMIQTYNEVLDVLINGMGI